MIVVRRRRRLFLGLVLALAVLAGAVVALRLVTSRDDSGDTRRIPVSGGAEVLATVSVPTGAKNAPLVVMPAGWAVPVTAYRLLARHLVAAGYATIVYSQRGQVGSSGKIDYAGPATRTDVSRVIDWALEHLDVDRAAIGMWGTSYGAAIALLAAAEEPRIRAVVATSTWADLAADGTPNDTVATQTLGTLFHDARLTPAIERVARTLTADPQAVAAQFRELSPVRSPSSYVKDLNRNRPAIMLVNGFEDRYINSNGLVSFYDALTTPKRLELQGGDHGGPGYDGILGRADRVTDNGVAWLDHYLRGRTENITSQPPVQLQDVTTGALRTYRTFPSATPADVFDLAAPGGGIDQTPATWSSGITTGTDTGATSGEAASYPPVTSSNATAPSPYAASWTGPSIVAPTAISGSMRVRLTIAATTPAVTLFAHVYDLAPTGVGTLMSFEPYTALGLRTGVPRSLNLQMPAIAWTLAAGHRVALVVDTVDPRYHSAAPAGSPVVLSSSTSAPATLSVPLG